MTAPYQPSTGLSSLQAKVLSVNGNLAACQDQLGRQIQVRRDWMRAKGTDMPQPGETWMITKEFGNTWSFGLLLSASKSPPGSGPAMIVFPSQAARDAMQNVPAGQLCFRLDSGLTDIYNGQSWHGMRPVPAVSPVIASASMPLASGASGTVVSFPVYDPGWPYQIAFSGAVTMTVPTGIGVELGIRDGSPTGTGLIPAFLVPQDGSRATAPASYPVLGTSVTLTGSRTLYVTVKAVSTGGTVTIAASQFNQIYAELRPVP